MNSDYQNFIDGLVFGFDVGNGSIGYAVRRGKEFLDVGMLICDSEGSDWIGMGFDGVSPYRLFDVWEDAVYCAGERSTLPLSVVPRKKPAPKFWFCKTTPLTAIGLPVSGFITLPLNRPDEGLKVSLSALCLSAL